MPALQVKDFPAELYEELRACAAAEDRSISQQTVRILREYLRAYRQIGGRTGWVVVPVEREEVRHGASNTGRRCSSGSMRGRISRSPTIFRLPPKSFDRCARNAMTRSFRNWQVSDDCFGLQRRR